MASATQQMVAELQKSNLSIQMKWFELTLFRGEVGDRAKSPWTVLYGFTYWDGSLDAFPTWDGVILDNGQLTTAAGFAQVTRSTHKDWVKLPGAPSGWHPQDQIALVALGATDRYRRRSGGRDLEADLTAGLLGEIAVRLRGTWPGGMNNFCERYKSSIAMLQAKPPPNETVLVSGTNETIGRFEIVLRPITEVTTPAIAGVGIGDLIMPSVAPTVSPAIPSH